MTIPQNVIDWLLGSNHWTNYVTRRNILNENIRKTQLFNIQRKITSDIKIKSLIQDVQNYFLKVATRHTDAKLSHYKFRMLADFGLANNDELNAIVKEVKSHKTGQFYEIRQILPTKKVDVTKEWNALPCDNPIILYTLLKIGANDRETDKQIDLMKEKWENKTGWFCHLPFVESQYKKEQIACPMAGMAALEVFSQIDELKESKYAMNAYETILYHNKIGKSLYYFGRGKKFFTLKYPFIWYNALYMADVLTRFKFTKKEKLVKDLITWIENSCDDEGKYTASSIYLEYKEWDFGNKKNPSPWITYLCYKVLKQYEE